MSRKHLKPRDKVTQRMTRDGVVLENQTTGEEINISDREEEQDFTPAGATGRAEKVLERAEQVRERRSMKKAAKQAGQVEADTGPRPSARLQFSEEERSTPELKKYIRKSDQRADRLDAARAAYAVQDEHNLRLYDTALDMAAINKALVVQDVAVISSQICNDTLEDYFKQITGGEGIA